MVLGRKVKGVSKIQVQEGEAKDSERRWRETRQLDRAAKECKEFEHVGRGSEDTAAT